MSKIMKNTMKYGFMALTALGLAILLLAPNSVDARERPGTYKGYSEDYIDTTYNPTPVVTKPYSNDTTGYVVGTTVKVTPTKATTNSASTTDYKEVKEEFSDLTANALSGANSFFPSSLMGWLLFAIFVLLIIILARKFFGLEDKYHSTPLKHS